MQSCSSYPSPLHMLAWSSCKHTTISVHCWLNTTSDIVVCIEAYVPAKWSIYRRMKGTVLCIGHCMSSNMCRWGAPRDRIYAYCHKEELLSYTLWMSSQACGVYNLSCSHTLPACQGNTQLKIPEFKKTFRYMVLCLESCKTGSLWSNITVVSICAHRIFYVSMPTTGQGDVHLDCGSLVSLFKRLGRLEMGNLQGEGVAEWRGGGCM